MCCTLSQMEAWLLVPLCIILLIYCWNCKPKKKKQKLVERLPIAKETEDIQVKDIWSFFSRTIQPKKNKLVSKEPDVIKID